MVDWERQKGESSKSYAWFKVYRDLGSKRTFPKVLEKIRKDNKCTSSVENITPTPTLNNLGKQSSRWHWKKRCRSYDNYQDRLELEANNEAYVETKDRLIEIGNQTMKVTEKILNELCDDFESKPTSKAHAVKSVADSFEKTTKTIRLLYGKSTEIKDATIEADIGAEVDKNEKIVNVDLTSDTFCENELTFLKELINEKDKK